QPGDAGGSSWIVSDAARDLSDPAYQTDLLHRIGLGRRWFLRQISDLAHLTLRLAAGFEQLWPDARKRADIGARRLSGENDAVGETETERVDVAIPEPIRSRAESPHRSVLIALNGSDNAGKHPLCLLGIAGVGDRDGNYGQETQYRSEPSHGVVSSFGDKRYGCAGTEARIARTSLSATIKAR